MLEGSIGKAYQLEIIDFEAIRMISKKTVVKSGENAKKHWQSFIENGDSQFLQKYANRTSPDCDFIGWMGNYDNEARTFIEMSAIFASEGSIVPKSFDFIDVPKCKMAVLWITAEAEGIEKGAHNVLLKKLIGDKKRSLKNPKLSQSSYNSQTSLNTFYTILVF